MEMSLNNKAKFIIIHGTGGKPNSNWFPWLKSELSKKAIDVAIPSFPTIQGQSLDNWQNAFREQIGSLQPNTTLIGHSLGAGFILNLLEKSSNPIKATYLVCGFLGKLNLPAYDTVNESFVCREFDWQKIRQNAGHCCVINSDNDPYVPLSKGEELAAKMGVNLTLLPGAKHINKEAGFTNCIIVWISCPCQFLPKVFSRR